MEMDETVIVNTAAKKKVTKKPTGAKAKTNLSKQPSKEKKTTKASPEANEVVVIESDDTVASASPSGKKKVAKNPKVKPTLTKQGSKEGGGNAAESKKATASYLHKVQEAMEAFEEQDIESDASVASSSSYGKKKVAKNPKVKPTLTKQSSKEGAGNAAESKKAPGSYLDMVQEAIEAVEEQDIESDASVASSSSYGKKKVAKNPKVKPTLTKQSSKEGAGNAAESKKATGSYLDMVQEAIEAVGVPRKGASVQAIKKYIHDKKDDGNDKKMDTFINKALVRGVEKGVFRKTNKVDKAGAVGSFALVKPQKPPKKPKTHHANGSDEEEGHVSDSETFIKPKRVGLLRKRNLSDSALNTMMSSTPKPSKLKVIKTPRMVKAIAKPKNVREVDDRRESSDTEAMVKPKVVRTLKSSSSDTDLSLFLSKAKKAKVDDTKKQKLADTRTKKGEKAELPPPKQPKSKARKLQNSDAKDETHQKAAAVKSVKAKSKKKA